MLIVGNSYMLIFKWLFIAEGQSLDDAIAGCSLFISAAKMEETEVPLCLDLQVDQ